MVTTFMEKSQKQLLKKFHTLLGKVGATEAEKEAILESYGVESSRDLSAKELLDICDRLSMRADPKLEKLDMWRKRVIAVTFRYCEAVGQLADIDYVKKIACRASGYARFNQIPEGRLINIYYAFKDKVKDINSVNSIAGEDLLKNICLN